MPRASKKFYSIIDRIRPDTIWIVPHQWAIPPLGHVLPHKDVPYHISIHDYPDAHHPERTIGRDLTTDLVVTVENLYRRAASRDTISNEMAADMESRTGASANQILHAGVEPADFEYLEQAVPVNRDVIKIAYAGTIVARQTVLAFVRSLTHVRKEIARRIELHLFSAHTSASQPWFNREWMIEHGELGASELLAHLRECDWGLAPMELTDENPRYNRFSLPTKVVSYLAAGLPTICIAHSSSTIAHLAGRYSLGIQIDETNADRIDEILRVGLSNSEERARRRLEIVRCARAEFDAETMRARLYTRLCSNTGAR
ncbi:MAG: hypothetical protein M3128_00390 [Verrucomicrobiota bacterium]|nr:hypothetical protein [Verrucomicrobiota bacterium]